MRHPYLLLIPLVALFLIFSGLERISNRLGLHLAPLSPFPKKTILSKLPSHLIKPAQAILEYEMEIKNWLGVSRIYIRDCELHRPERDLWGPMLKFTATTEKGTVVFYAKLRHSKKKYNPTPLEYQLTLEASAAGLAPPAIVISNALLIREIQGVSLEQITTHLDLLREFLSHEEELVKKIGEVYGILNTKLRILHEDVKKPHIFITPNRRVLLIDFSTLRDEGGLSRRIAEGSPMSDLDDLYILIDYVVKAYWQHYEELKKLGVDLTTRSWQYHLWLKEGYERGCEATQIISLPNRSHPCEMSL